MIGLFLLCFSLDVSAAGPMPATPETVAELASVELPEPPLEDPPDSATAAARTKQLQSDLRCPVCQGLSVGDSPSDAARAMAQRIEELVQQGYTEDQITSYFVERYGAWVELEPPSGQHQALFWAPIGAVGLGLLGIAAFGRRKKEPSTPTTAHTPDPGLEPWRARILAELDGDA